MGDLLKAMFTVVKWWFFIGCFTLLFRGLYLITGDIIFFLIIVFSVSTIFAYLCRKDFKQ